MNNGPMPLWEQMLHTRIYGGNTVFDALTEVDNMDCRRVLEQVRDEMFKRDFAKAPLSSATSPATADEKDARIAELVREKIADQDSIIFHGRRAEKAEARIAELEDDVAQRDAIIARWREDVRAISLAAGCLYSCIPGHSQHVVDKATDMRANLATAQADLAAARARIAELEADRKANQGDYGMVRDRLDAATARIAELQSYAAELAVAKLEIGQERDALRTALERLVLAFDVGDMQHTAANGRGHQALRDARAALSAPSSPTAPVAHDIEAIAAEVHAQWVATKLAGGVTSRRSEAGEELMVPYWRLSDAAKELDRVTVRTVLGAVALARTPAAPPAPGAEGERLLRMMLAFAYSGSRLYCDDGELQDSSAHPFIDFLNDPVEELQRKIKERGRAAWAKVVDAKAEGDAGKWWRVPEYALHNGGLVAAEDLPKAAGEARP